MFEFDQVKETTNQIKPDDSLDYSIYELSCNYLEEIYPRKLIWRIIYLPVNGHWFPFADIKDFYAEMTQLTFFYDSLHITIPLSSIRICGSCERPLERMNRIRNIFPLSLCKLCVSEIFYQYVDCLEGIYLTNLQKFLNKEKILEKKEMTSLCSNLLQPRCNYPLSFESTNPCLRNHAIGIIFKDFYTIQIIIGLEHSLKYKILWEGGIFAVIFGSKFSILNIEILNSVLGELFTEVINFTHNFNANQNLNMKFNINWEYIDDNEVIINKFLESWFLLQFLDYYQNYRCKQYINYLFKNVIEYYLEIIAFLNNRFNFDVICYLELYKMYPPINLGLRTEIERTIETEMFVNSIDELFKLHYAELDRDLSRILNTFLKSFPSLSKKQTTLEIYKIYAALGPTLLIQSNLDLKPSILYMKECIGTLIQ